MLLFLPAKVRRNLTPLLCLPFDDRVMPLMGLKPSFSTKDDLKEFFSLWGTLQLGLTLSFVHPENGIIGVAIDGFVM